MPSLAVPITFRRNDPLRGTEAERRIGEALREGWQPLGEKLVEWLRSKSPTYKGTYKKSHKLKTRGVGLKTALVVFSNDRLAKYKDHGRGKGKFAPPPAMLAYVRFKGWHLRGSHAPLKTQQKSLAFLIGRRQSEKGTKNPPHLYDQVVDANQGTITQAIKRLSSLVAEKLSRP